MSKERAEKEGTCVKDILVQISFASRRRELGEMGAWSCACEEGVSCCSKGELTDDDATHEVDGCGGGGIHGVFILCDGRGMGEQFSERDSQRRQRSHTTSQGREEGLVPEKRKKRKRPRRLEFYHSTGWVGGSTKRTDAEVGCAGRRRRGRGEVRGDVRGDVRRHGCVVFVQRARAPKSVVRCFLLCQAGKTKKT